MEITDLKFKYIILPKIGVGAIVAKTFSKEMTPGIHTINVTLPNSLLLKDKIVINSPNRIVDIINWSSDFNKEKENVKNYKNEQKRLDEQSHNIYFFRERLIYLTKYFENAAIFMMFSKIKTNPSYRYEKDQEKEKLILLLEMLNKEYKALVKSGEKLTGKNDKIRTKINEIQRMISKNRYEFKINVVKQGVVSFDIVYFQFDAGKWTSLVSIKENFKLNRVEETCNVSIWNGSYEDWKDAQIILTKESFIPFKKHYSPYITSEVFPSDLLRSHSKYELENLFEYDYSEEFDLSVYHVKGKHSVKSKNLGYGVEVYTGLYPKATLQTFAVKNAFLN